MAPVLLLQLRNTITSPLISIFSKKFEENEQVLKKSIDTSLCTVLLGLENISSNTALFDKLLESVTQTGFYKNTEFENGKIASINYSFEQEGFSPLIAIFSTKKSRVPEMISNEIGVKSGTATAILNFAVMLTLLHLSNEKLKASNLQEDLNSHKKFILNNIPEGIRVLLGYSNFEYEVTYADSDLGEKKYIKSNFLNKFFKF